MRIFPLSAQVEEHAEQATSGSPRANAGDAAAADALEGEDAGFEDSATAAKQRKKSDDNKDNAEEIGQFFRTLHGQYLLSSPHLKREITSCGPRTENLSTLVLHFEVEPPFYARTMDTKMKILIASYEKILASMDRS